jgi:type II secretory pathway component PulK
MKTAFRHKSDGMALILAMIAIFVLSALAAGFALSMKVEARLAQNADNEQQMLWLGRSGVEQARYILSQQLTIPNEPYDALNQFWACGTSSADSTNSAFSGLSMDNCPVGTGTFKITAIIDLERKVNINTANGDALRQALTLMGVDASEISVVADSILDWIDPDDAPGPAGAESDYYQGLAVPYYAKNAPIDNLTELLLVKGVTPEMYWGSNATNHTPSVFQHKLGFGTAPGQAPDYPFGLVNIFTPVSLGRININTADTNVLQMIPGVDAATAADIVMQRAGPDGVEGTDDDMPFRSVNDLGRLNTALTGQQLNSLCTVRSSTFEVHVTAQMGDYQREYIAILFRNSGLSIQVLSFYWK